MNQIDPISSERVNWLIIMNISYPNIVQVNNDFKTGNESKRKRRKIVTSFEN